MAHCRGRPPDREKRTRHDGRQYRDLKNEQVWVQQAPGARLGIAAGSRPEVSAVIEPEQIHEGCDSFKTNYEEGNSLNRQRHNNKQNIEYDIEIIARKKGREKDKNDEV